VIDAPRDTDGDAVAFLLAATGSRGPRHRSGPPVGRSTIRPTFDGHEHRSKRGRCCAPPKSSPPPSTPTSTIYRTSRSPPTTGSSSPAPTARRTRRPAKANHQPSGPRSTAFPSPSTASLMINAEDRVDQELGRAFTECPGLPAMSILCPRRDRHTDRCTSPTHSLAHCLDLLDRNIVFGHVRHVGWASLPGSARKPQRRSRPVHP